MERGAIVTALSRVELFRGLDEAIIDRIAGIAREWSIPPGRHVYFAGDLATQFFVVVSGRVRAFLPSPGEDLTVTILEPGHLFGEMALLDGGPRATTAVALEPTLLLEVDREDWLDLAANDIALSHRVFEALGASVRRYARDLVDLQFVDLEIPGLPPVAGTGA
jgi:CRP/FNR family transcriptional regulator, cyclic AMP receptor protein